MASTKRPSEETAIVSSANISALSGISAHKLQRKQRLESLVHQRISNFDYLRKAYEGGSFWLNVVLLTRSHVKDLVMHVPKQRTVSYYYLGLSIHSVLELKSGIATVRAFSQLLEEFEYYCSGAAMQGMKMLMAKNSPCVYPSLVAPANGAAALAAMPAEASLVGIAEDSSVVKPVLSKFQNVVMYERLLTPHLSFDLDYVQVITALCEALSKIYDKLFAAECFHNSMVYEAILRLDGRVKQHVINIVTKELTDYCCKVVKTDTAKLRANW